MIVKRESTPLLQNHAQKLHAVRHQILSFLSIVSIGIVIFCVINLSHRPESDLSESTKDFRFKTQKLPVFWIIFESMFLAWFFSRKRGITGSWFWFQTVYYESRSDFPNWSPFPSASGWTTAGGLSYESTAVLTPGDLLPSNGYFTVGPRTGFQPHVFAAMYPPVVYNITHQHIFLKSSKASGSKSSPSNVSSNVGGNDSRLAALERKLAEDEEKVSKMKIEVRIR